jgi:hypothetical protein
MYIMNIYILCQVGLKLSYKKNAPQEAGQYLILVARGGIEPQSQEA